MRSIKGVILIVALFWNLQTSAQSQTEKRWSGETCLLASVYRLGSYQKERSTIFLEQRVHYQFNHWFSLGAGIGINAYPALLGFPIYVNGQYHFNIKSIPFSIAQSYGRNIKLSEIFFSSNRYVGELKANLNLGKIDLTPRVGYNYLWDQYDGRSLSFLVGVGLEYPLGLKKD